GDLAHQREGGVQGGRSADEILEHGGGVGVVAERNALTDVAGRPRRDERRAPTHAPPLPGGAAPHLDHRKRPCSLLGVTWTSPRPAARRAAGCLDSRACAGTRSHPLATHGAPPPRSRGRSGRRSGCACRSLPGGPAARDRRSPASARRALATASPPHAPN